MLRGHKRAFTVVDLVVTVGALALVAATVGQTLTATRARSRMTTCLGNLGQVGTAMLAYAADDADELVIPIHRRMVKSVPYWQWRTVNWFAWGGQNATVAFEYLPMAKYWLSDEPGEGQWIPEYGASQRPLNAYVPGEPGTYGIFHCPQDVGYPADIVIDDSPAAQAGIPCWEGIGNSYRANLFSFTAAGGGMSPSAGHFSVGPWGQALSTLFDPGRQVLVADPFFYTEAWPGSYGHWGWHGQWKADNVLFCDGSARLTSAETVVTGAASWKRSVSGLASSHFDMPEICSGSEDSLVSGTTWRLDCYPTMGAVIWGDWSAHGGQDCWPWGGVEPAPEP